MTDSREHAIGDLSGRVALVTGAGSGIGLSISRCFAATGARVMALDRDERGRAPFAEAVGADGPDYAEVDVADREAVAAAVAELEARAGRIDVLVNSAGIRDVGSALDISAEEWQRVLDVDLTGTFNCCLAVAPGMLERRHGSIVNIASIAGMFGFARRTAYTVAKHGVLGLTRTLAAQFGPSGVRVNAICPGLIETPLTHAIVSDAQTQESFRVLVPLQRAGRPEEIAAAALFLAGDGSRFITGVPLPVDGGFTAMVTYDTTGSLDSAFEQPVSVLDETR
jgi:NAD(P)-dependent dehydrogenase (short-subunit alcohol dehydrogenase family)